MAGRAATNKRAPGLPCPALPLLQVAVIGMDKTGTLTAGAFRVVHLDLSSASHSHSGASSSHLDERAVLRLVASLERGATHPIAAAIVGRAAAQVCPSRFPPTSCRHCCCSCARWLPFPAAP